MSLYEDRNENFYRRLRAAQDRFERSVARLGAELLQLGVELNEERERVAKDRGRLEKRKDEPEVLVRRPGGASLSTFHDPTDPCGRVRDPSDFRRMLIGEAVKMGLSPCSACGHTPPLERWLRAYRKAVKARADKLAADKQAAEAAEAAAKEKPDDDEGGLAAVG